MGRFETAWGKAPDTGVLWFSFKVAAKMRTNRKDYARMQQVEILIVFQI